jgi:hypothetical protein
MLTKYDHLTESLDTAIIGPSLEMGDSRDGGEFLQALVQYAYVAKENHLDTSGIKNLLFGASGEHRERLVEPFPPFVQTAIDKICNLETN